MNSLKTTSSTLSYGTAIKQSMSSLMREFPNTLLMGQGVTDPTRIFGTVAGLLEEHGPGRVLEMPIAEEGMTGFGLGAALNGLYPIQTHIRVDFLVLALNQVINHMAKYRYMYGGAFGVPMLVRAVIGRSWGQGPQHSQSLQSLLAHIPGLTVIMPSSASAILDSYRHAVSKFGGPVISIEHRLLYDHVFNVSDEAPAADPFKAVQVRKGGDVTIVATSIMVLEAQRAALWLQEKKGISCDIIDPHVVSNIDHDLISESVSKTGHLLVADTSWKSYGVCAEVCRGLMERDFQKLKKPVLQLGMGASPTPTSHSLERFFYPDMGTIVDGVYQLLYGSAHGLELPSEEFKKSQKKAFKGPF